MSRTWHHAADVWQEAITAIQNCCKSFNKAYPAPQVETKTQNGHRQPDNTVPLPIITRVAVEFKENQSDIVVTVDDRSPRHFKIEADENRCYITSGGKEITADEFSRLALEDSLLSRLKRS